LGRLRFTFPFGAEFGAELGGSEDLLDKLLVLLTFLMTEDICYLFEIYSWMLQCIIDRAIKEIIPSPQVVIL